MIDEPMVREEDAYYAARDRFNVLIKSGRSDTQEAAKLFYYLNQAGFNGVCRFNSSGKFNVPIGKSKTPPVFRKDFTAYQPLLSPWEFTQGDFEKLVLRPDDFVYADPPYDVEFTKYSKEDFKWPHQVRLAKWLAKHAGPVVASNQATSRIVDLALLR